HFLYSGSYETINSPLDEGEPGITREYRKAVLTYQASRAYKLPALEALAKRYMELFSEAMSTPEILRITREVFSKLPEDETWFSNHIKSSLEQWLVPGESASNLDSLYTALGQDHSFDNVVTKMMLEILSCRLRCLETIEDKNNWYGQISNHGDETLGERTAGAVQRSKDSQLEGLPARHHPEPEEVPVESYPEDTAVAAEDCPEPEEAPVEADPEGAVAEVHPAREESLAEEFPVPEKYTTKLHLTPHLLENVYLYENWGILSPKKRRSRTRTLRARGLPIPDKDGVISTFRKKF
ncbi:hypothetical protein IFM51744_10042, partial [Aspergillus udagawae]